jgi:hypothetical protein
MSLQTTLRHCTLMVCQLNLQMVAGLTFPFYSEARITFLPTYKYDIGTDVYDTSEKARIPAWCDRILRKGDNIRQINYDCAPLRFSDHRPVYATFQCLINKIDESRKEQLSQELYSKRKEVVGDTRASSGAAMEDTDVWNLVYRLQVQIDENGGLITGSQPARECSHPAMTTSPIPSGPVIRLHLHQNLTGSKSGQNQNHR